MKALVVYESVYGNTREVAVAIAAGLRTQLEVDLAAVHQASAEAAADAELLIVGGPTHMHGLTSSLSRKMAVQAATDEGIEVEPGAADQLGLRGWLTTKKGDGRMAGAFDTRIDKSPTLTGAASRGIARRMKRGGFTLIAAPESFFVEDSEGPLAEGELERAEEWGLAVAMKAVAGTPKAAPAGRV